MGLLSPLVGALAALLLPGLAQAQARLANHHIDLVAGTDFPLLVGGGISWEAPARLRASFHAGFLPGPYVDIINQAMVGLGAYDQSVATLIDAALQHSILLRPELGYRPFPKLGLSVHAGYQYVGLGGDSSEIGLFSGGVDALVIQLAQQATGTVDLRVQDHMLTGGVSYEWLVQDRLVIRADLAFSGSLLATAQVDASRQAAVPFGNSALDAFEAPAEAYLSSVFEKWVHLPTAGLYVGYRFK